jgi:flagellin
LTDAKTIGVAEQGTLAGQSVGSAYAKAEAINAASVPGLTVQAQNNIEFTVAATTGTGTGAAYNLRINGQDVFAYDQETGGVLSTQQIADAINAQSGTTGVTADLTGANLRLSASDGRDINISQTFGGAAGGGITAGAGGASTVNGTTYRDGTLTATITDASAYSVVAGAVNGGTLKLSATENISVTGDGIIMGFATAGFTAAKDTTTLSSANVLTLSAANDSLQRIDAALTSVSNLRSQFGAIQNRFESTIANLTAVSENLQASRSRIQDADFAAETAALTRAQILQQAGTAILAQANAAPQTVLALLQ